jgi:hypothetical protein
MSGNTDRLPEFLIIGAMKCGTTTLQAQLAAQPGVFMTTPKEPNFFSDDAVYARGLDWYRSLYDAAAPGDLKGEASTHYTKRPTHPETVARLQAVLPAPRLVYMIRNPIDRAVSHYIHEWSEGLMTADPVAAFKTHAELVAYGRYPMQLAPYLDAFGQDSLLLTSLEQITADPEGELRRIGTHLGLPGVPVWDHGLGAQNVSAERVRRLPLHGLLVENAVARVLRRTLVPKSLRTRIRQARTHGERPKLPEDLRARLQATFAGDRAEMARLFPGHPALTLCYGFVPQ